MTGVPTSPLPCTSLCNPPPPPPPATPDPQYLYRYGATLSSTGTLVYNQLDGLVYSLYGASGQHSIGHCISEANSVLGTAVWTTGNLWFTQWKLDFVNPIIVGTTMFLEEKSLVHINTSPSEQIWGFSMDGNTKKLIIYTNSNDSVTLTFTIYANDLFSTAYSIKRFAMPQVDYGISPLTPLFAIWTMDVMSAVDNFIMLACSAEGVYKMGKLAGNLTPVFLTNGMLDFRAVYASFVTPANDAVFIYRYNVLADIYWKVSVMVSGVEQTVQTIINPVDALLNTPLSIHGEMGVYASQSRFWVGVGNVITLYVKTGSTYAASTSRTLTHHVQFISFSSSTLKVWAYGSHLTLSHTTLVTVMNASTLTVDFIQNAAGVQTLDALMQVCAPD